MLAYVRVTGLLAVEKTVAGKGVQNPAMTESIPDQVGGLCPRDPVASWSCSSAVGKVLCFVGGPRA